jgi:hypothetical protein
MRDPDVRAALLRGELTLAMSERKNIFLLGRLGHEANDGQLTEMLAFSFLL